MTAPDRPPPGTLPRRLSMALGLGFCALAVAYHVTTPAPNHATPRPMSDLRAEDALSPLRSAHPGRGRDFRDATIRDHAMAYALVASAAVLMEDVSLTRTAADWLVASAERGGAWGWGLPFAWDAFGDGSENPPGTIYGITTALAVRALLDAHDLTGTAEYAGTARRALDYYRQFYTPASNDAGYFWYSDRACDSKAVHNVSAMLSGQYARASVHWRAASYREAADSARRYVWDSRRSSPAGTEWAYGAVADRPNDAVHAAYLVQGLMDYSRATGQPFDDDGAIRYLTGFLDRGAVLEFNPDSVLGSARPGASARLWGVGMLIYTLADAGRTEEAQIARRALRHYEFRERRLGNLPGQREFIPRAQAHVALGLARLERDSLLTRSRRPS